MKRSIGPSKKNQKAPCRLKEVIWKSVGAKGVLLNLTNGNYFEVNPVGLEIWEQCDGRKSLDSIAQAVSRRFSVRPEKALSDSQRFLRRLAGLKMAVLP